MSDRASHIDPIKYRRIMQQLHEIEMENWKVAEGRPPILFKDKFERAEILNHLIGNNTWLVAWKRDGKFYNFIGECFFYEESYSRFLRSNPVHVDWLVENARDVYDVSTNDVLSQHDYMAQDGRRIHIQDIAVRRVINLEFRKKFNGSKLVRIRSKGERDETIYPQLSPFYVPCHEPRFIDEVGPLDGPYDKGSVEQYHKSAKRLLLSKPAAEKIGEDIWRL